MSKVFLLGSGYSLIHYKDKLKKIKDDTIGFQHFYPHCIDYFDMVPTHWTFIDTGSSIKGLDFILQNPDMAPKNIVLPSFCLKEHAIYQSHVRLGVHIKTFLQKNIETYI